MALTEKIEDTILLNSMFNDMFLETWRGNKNSIYESLELIISPECNLACKYCYIHHYGHKLYPKETRNDDTIVENAKKVFDWLIKNKLAVRRLEFFSGEIFAQEVGYRVLEAFYEKYKNVPRELTPSIMIPTNYTFINDEEATKRVQGIIDKFKEAEIRVFLSASFDGKYMEQNRPYKKDLDLGLDAPRDDEYYDKAFSFAKRNGYGFHPMVYSEGIEHWKENFLWFQEMFKKHNIDWKNMYLLQVRNAEWSQEQIKHLKEFMVFLMEWTFNKVGRNKKAFMKVMDAPYRGFNILKGTTGTQDKGLPCSIQTDPSIRLSDLKFVPCHRLMYEGQEYGQFEVVDGEITGHLEAINTEMFIGVMSHNYKYAPYCSTCAIRNCCTGGCIGSQFEITGDPFMPIPSMCAMQHSLIAGFIEGALKIDMYDELKIFMSKEQVEEHETVKNYITSKGDK